MTAILYQTKPLVHCSPFVFKTTFSADIVMQRLFGRPKDPMPASSATSAGKDQGVLSEIADSKEKIEKRTEYLRHKAQKETSDAITHKNGGRKDQALACLKRKKLIDEEINSLTQSLLKLDVEEHTLSALEFSKTVIGIEKRATDAIKKKLKEIGDISSLDDQRGDTEEALEDAYDLLGVVAQPVSVPGMEQDDDELLEELAKLEEEEEAAKLADQLASIETEALPVPKNPVPLPVPDMRSRQKQDEDEVRELAEIDQLAASMRVEMSMPGLGSANGLMPVACA